MRRAALSIGVNRASNMTPLQAAAKGARAFEAWARKQGCATKLLTDDTRIPVVARDIFNAVTEFVNARIYNQLTIFFSGHGILTAPGTEFWLLSDAPLNPNEAVNLLRSIEDARNSGIPHIVFVSDACRSSVQGPPLSAVTGSIIFPNQGLVQQRAEVDVFYATRPGDPAYEVPEDEATARYQGIFTQSLLTTLKSPPPSLVESIQTTADAPLMVITSRKLKPHLESTVPVSASQVNVKLRQIPELRVETALPKYFAEVAISTINQSRGVTAAGPPPPPRTIDLALEALKAAHLRGASFSQMPSTRELGGLTLADQIGLTEEVQRITESHGRGRFETQTGFTVFGTKPMRVDARFWRSDEAFKDTSNTGAWHLRMNSLDPVAKQGSTAVVEFDSNTGAALPIIPGFIATLIVDHGRIVSVSYVPSNQTSRYQEYLYRAGELEDMRALATVAARHGKFVVESEHAADLAERIRQAKNLDPTLGLYAAYAYAQVGRYDDVYSVFRFMTGDIEVPVPFDVMMLASRAEAFTASRTPFEHIAPFAPMLAQGWALLMPEDSLYRPIHQRLRPHLVPSLWTTLDYDGIVLAREAISSGEVI